MKGYRGKEMKKRLIFVVLLIVPHTVWLVEVAQEGGQGGRTTRQPLQTILEGGDQNEGERFLTSPMSPPPVKQRPLKKAHFSESFVKLKGPNEQRLNEQWNWPQIDHGSFERHYPIETHEYIGWDFVDGDIKRYSYQDRTTGDQIFVFVKERRVVGITTNFVKDGQVVNRSTDL